MQEEKACSVNKDSKHFSWLSSYSFSSTCSLPPKGFSLPITHRSSLVRRMRREEATSSSSPQERLINSFTPTAATQFQTQYEFLLPKVSHFPLQAVFSNPRIPLSAHMDSTFSLKLLFHLDLSGTSEDVSPEVLLHLVVLICTAHNIDSAFILLK